MEEGWRYQRSLQEGEFAQMNLLLHGLESPQITKGKRKQKAQ